LKSTWFAVVLGAAVVAAPATFAHDYVTLYMTVNQPNSAAATATFTYDSDPGPATSFRDSQDGIGYLAEYTAVPGQADSSLEVTVLDGAGNTISPAGPCQPFRITHQAAKGGFYELKFVFRCGLDDTAHQTQYVLQFSNQTRGDTMRTYAAGGRIPSNLPRAAFESVTFSYSINHCADGSCAVANGGGDVVTLTRGTPAGMSFFGEWSPLVAYSSADMVIHNGTTWVAIVDSTIAPPGSDFSWVKVGAAGARGATGARGAAGPRGAIGPAGPAGVVDVTELNDIQETLAALSRQVSSLNAQVAKLTSQNAALQADLQLATKVAFGNLEVSQVAEIYLARLDGQGLEPAQTLNAVSAQLGIRIHADQDALLTQDDAQCPAAVHSLEQQLAVGTAALNGALAHGDRAQALEWQSVLDGLNTRLAQVQQGLRDCRG